MNTVALATFNELEAAWEFQERLQRMGIKTSINDESQLERFWFMSEPIASIHVEVDQPDYLRARQLVMDWDREGEALRKAVRCPECRSSRVEFPQFTRKFLTPRVASLLLAIKLLPREFYCLDCQFTWPLTPPVKPELDVLGWPYDSKLWHPERVNTTKR